jgi:3-hydroxyisobutyrate dehydrogenase-like beta-hydroxyacid dehydrogenase
MPKPIRHIGPIGLIGLGLMGNAIAARLLAAGFTVLGFDIAPKARAAFRKLGGQLADHNRDIFTRCDRVLLSLPDSKITRAVLREVTPALRYGHIIADTSTGDPQDAIAFSQQLASTGALYLDATISGNSDQVRRGEVVTMIGGSKHGFNQCAKTLRAFAKLALHTGPVGSAAQMKLVTNLVLGLNRAALAEGLVFARTLGLDAKLTLTVLRSSMAYSRIMDVKGEKMISGDFKPQARLSQHLKDVRLMLASAKKSEVALPLSDTHRKILEAAEAAGYGQLDNSAIIRVIGAPFSKSACPKATRLIRSISPAQ